MRKLENNELNRLSVNDYKNRKKTPVVVVLDNIRSANNVGSVFRTCDAFLVEAIHLCGITATPPNRDIQKTAIGATQSVEWVHFNQTLDAVRKLQDEGYQVFAIEQCEGGSLLPDHHVAPNQKIAFIFGNEVTGVSQKVVDRCDGCIEIPQWGTKHSFNISVSAGIVLWDYINNTTAHRAKK